MKRSWTWLGVCMVAFLWSAHLFVVGCTTGPVNPGSEGTTEVTTEKGTEQVADGSAESTVEPAVEMGVEPVAEMGSDAGETTPEAVAETTPEQGPAVPDKFDGAPIQAPEKTWTWVDFPDTKCGYGSATGLGINLNPGAKRVLIYLQGGGACWSEGGLIGACFGQSSASNLSGFDKARFDQMGEKNSFFFDRTKPENVFADAHYVFIPYCTGDVFSGDKTTTYASGKTMNFHGFRNIIAYLKRLVPTFKDVEHVVFSGSSAGGFGASMNWWVARKAFGENIKVDLMNDSAPPMDPVEGRWEEWTKAWNIQLPPDCADCSQGISNILNYMEKNIIAKGGRMGYMGRDKDQVIRIFFGYTSDLTGEKFKAAHDKLLDRLDQIGAGVGYFVLSGSQHTFLGSPENIKGADGTALPVWIERMVMGDTAWKSTKP
ncbi:MAG: hypothetical protein H6727_02495 [Myxococcales bacterium]|nr:hypothetical protein [Myxococcales bacterium]